jgi:hypothetical protein
MEEEKSVGMRKLEEVEEENVEVFLLPLFLAFMISFSLHPSFLLSINNFIPHFSLFRIPCSPSSLQVRTSHE